MSELPTIFQSSDLNQRGRSVLDAARDGFARVRDKDGVSLLMTREERVDELRRRNDVGDGIARATASFLLFERAVAHADRRPTLAEFGDWVWARELPAEDLQEFIAEIREALYTACREFSLDPLRDALDAWRETALALRAPLSRETLLGDDDDYVEVSRPAADTPETATA